MNTASSTNSTTRSGLTSSLPLPSSLSGKSCLYAVLNWGLGHATRSIPIINDLLNRGCNICIATDGDALLLLKNEFPNLEFIQLPSYRVKYGRSIWSIVLNNSFNVLLAIIKEHRALAKLISEPRFDFIISDSRFGFYSRKLPSYIISHQLMIPIKNPVLSYLVNKVNTHLLNLFTSVWIPDDEKVRLSGKMSENEKVKNKQFIGIRSRLTSSTNSCIYDLAIVLSGPEPSRTILESKLTARYKDSKQKIILVRGTVNSPRHDFPENWETIDLANSDQINDILLSTKEIISRSGYTSIMDYYSLGIPATLIPTPGQSEQEYLGKSLNGRYGFSCVDESEIHLFQIK